MNAFRYGCSCYTTGLAVTGLSWFFIVVVPVKQAVHFLVDSINQQKHTEYSRGTIEIDFSKSDFLSSSAVVCTGNCAQKCGRTERRSRDRVTQSPVASPSPSHDRLYSGYLPVSTCISDVSMLILSRFTRYRIDHRIFWRNSCFIFYIESGLV